MINRATTPTATGLKQIVWTYIINMFIALSLPRKEKAGETRRYIIYKNERQHEAAKSELMD